MADTVEPVEPVAPIEPVEIANDDKSMESVQQPENLQVTVVPDEAEVIESKLACPNEIEKPSTQVLEQDPVELEGVEFSLASAEAVKLSSCTEPLVTVQVTSNSNITGGHNLGQPKVVTKKPIVKSKTKEQEAKVPTKTIQVTKPATKTTLPVKESKKAPRNDKVSQPIPAATPKPISAGDKGFANLEITRSSSNPPPPPRWSLFGAFRRKSKSTAGGKAGSRRRRQRSVASCDDNKPKDFYEQAFHVYDDPLDAPLRFFETMIDYVVETTYFFCALGQCAASTSTGTEQKPKKKTRFCV